MALHVVFPWHRLKVLAIWAALGRTTSSLSIVYVIYYGTQLFFFLFVKHVKILPASMRIIVVSYCFSFCVYHCNSSFRIENYLRSYMSIFFKIVPAFSFESCLFF